MFGFGAETADGVFDVGGAEGGELRTGFAGEEFGEGATGGDGGRTAAGLVSCVDNHSGTGENRELQDVAAGRVGDLDGDGGRGQFADVAGVLEMIEELFRVHRSVPNHGFRVEMNEMSASPRLFAVIGPIR